MKVTGIIAEYNPFHNGHLYQITEAKKRTNADFILVVMSGDFMQRGTPAIVNKWERTRMALSHGADLVLELPAIFATASANLFALGGISLLAKTGVVTDLCFGAETDCLSDFLSLAEFLNKEPDFFKEHLKDGLKSGISFPCARSAALSSESITDSLPASSYDLLSAPNNILGVEYCKILLQISSSIQPHIIKREGAAYNDTGFTESNRFASASAIRNFFLTEENICDERVFSFLPAASAQILRNETKNNALLSEDCFSALLQYKLLSEENLGFSSYFDVNNDLSNRIRHALCAFSGWSDFALALKSKNITYTRINRALTHILLNITNEKLALAKTIQAPYLRILGFSKNASPLLSALKRNSSIPIITKLADAKKSLSLTSYDILKTDIFASDVYRTAKAGKTGKYDLNDYKQSPILVDRME